MEIDQDLINTIVTAVMGAFGFMAKMLHSSIKEVKKDNQILSEKIAETKLYFTEVFIPKNDLKEQLSTIINRLDKIDEKLDRKQDKE